MNGTIVLCMGTRPEIIKMAPVHAALLEAGLESCVLHTGQHEEMAWPLYDFFGIKPRHALTLRRASEDLAHLSARLLEEIHAALRRLQPGAVLVHGDTSSTLNAALAAFYQQVPVGHVEAGLRSGAMYDPFPEEKNRELVGRLARWHFAPTAKAADNLRREGVPSERIFMVGNTVVDAARWGIGHLARQPDGGLDVLPEELRALPQVLSGRRLVLVTAHRRENWGRGIEAIASAVRQCLERFTDVCVVWPVHANERVRRTVYDAFDGMADEPAARLFLVAPVDYPALLWVLERSWLAMTDSGGIQEEAMAVRVPVLVLRETTERPELIEAGGGVLVGAEKDSIVDRFTWLTGDPDVHAGMRSAGNPFGDGRAGQYIAAILGSAEASDEGHRATAQPTRAPTSLRPLVSTL